MLGWTLRIPALAQPEMTFSAALLFALAGIALLIPAHSGSQARFCIGGFLVVAGVLALLQELFHFAPLTDWIALQARAVDAGRGAGDWSIVTMQTSMALAFALAGTAFTLMRRNAVPAGARWRYALIELTTYGIVIVAIAGLAIHAIQLDCPRPPQLLLSCLAPDSGQAGATCPATACLFSASPSSASVFPRRRFCLRSPPSLH